MNLRPFFIFDYVFHSLISIYLVIMLSHTLFTSIAAWNLHISSWKFVSNRLTYPAGVSCFPYENPFLKITDDGETWIINIAGRKQLSSVTPLKWGPMQNWQHMSIRLLKVPAAHGFPHLPALEFYYYVIVGPQKHLITPIFSSETSRPVLLRYHWHWHDKYFLSISEHRSQNTSNSISRFWLGSQAHNNRTGWHGLEMPSRDNNHQYAHGAYLSVCCYFRYPKHCSLPCASRNQCRPPSSRQEGCCRTKRVPHPDLFGNVLRLVSFFAMVFSHLFHVVGD